MKDWKEIREHTRGIWVGDLWVIFFLLFFFLLSPTFLNWTHFASSAKNKT